MANQTVSSVYRLVIDDVIANLRPDFEDMGIDEAILQELQRLWENKVASARPASFVPEDAGFEGGEADYDPPVSTHHLQYVPDATDHHAAAASLASMATATASMKPDPDAPYNGAGKPQPFLPPPTHPPHPALPAHPTYPIHSAQTGRPNIPQTDGAWDMTTREIDALIEKAIMQARSSSDESSSSSADITLELDFPQVSLATARRALAEHHRSRQVDGNEDDEETEGDETINSDLDDSDEDEGIQDNGEDSGGDIILCLYEKVTRTKNKWKCVLKDGIMSVNGRDYVFLRANGDFEW